MIISCSQVRQKDFFFKTQTTIDIVFFKGRSDAILVFDQCKWLLSSDESYKEKVNKDIRIVMIDIYIHIGTLQKHYFDILGGFVGLSKYLFKVF